MSNNETDEFVLGLGLELSASAMSSNDRRRHVHNAVGTDTTNNVLSGRGHELSNMHLVERTVDGDMERDFASENHGAAELTEEQRKQKAAEHTQLLWTCMNANKEYYHALRQARKEVKHEMLRTASEMNNDIKYLAGAALEMAIDVSQLTDVKMHGTPFFRDSRGFGPPPNSDMVLKTQRKEIDAALIPKMLKWQRWELKLLDEAVRKNALSKLHQPFLSRRSVLQEQMRREKDFATSSRRLQAQLDQVSKDIAEQSGDPLFNVLHDPKSEFDWMRISATDFENRRTANECRAMWHNCLRFGIRREAWSKEETEHLVELAQVFKFQDWDMIAEKLGTDRTGYQCFIHYQSHLNHMRTRWTLLEDKKLKEAVSNNRVGNYINFSKVAAMLPGRNSQQVRQRWYTTVDPALKTGRFSMTEDLVLATGHQTQGLDFKDVARLLPGRTPAQLRQRYTKLANFSSEAWTPEEDSRLLELTGSYKSQKMKIPWLKLQPRFPNRAASQLRVRYLSLTKATHKSMARSHAVTVKKKKTVWKVWKDHIDPEKSSSLTKVNLPTFVRKIENRHRMGRRARPRDMLDQEISQCFRSWYNQPRGRKKIHFTPEEVADMANNCRALLMMLEGKVDFSKPQPAYENPFCALRPHHRSSLQLIYQHLRMEQLKNPQPPPQEHQSPPEGALLIPPNLTTLVGLRTALLEERNLLALGLMDHTEEQAECEIVHTPAGGEAPSSSAALFFKMIGVRKGEMKESRSQSAEQTTMEGEPPATQDAVPGPSSSAAGPSSQQPEAKAGPSSEGGSLSPTAEEALLLFQRRFISLFFWPALLTQNPPSAQLYDNLLSGTRLSRGAHNKGSGDEQQDAPAGAEETGQLAGAAQQKDKGPKRLTMRERKRMMRDRWMKFRDDRQRELATDGREEEPDDEEVEEARRREAADNVVRIPGRRGRPPRKRRVRANSRFQRNIQEATEAAKARLGKKDHEDSDSSSS